MNRFFSSPRRRVLVVTFWLAGLAATASAEEPAFRDLVRKYVADQSKGVTPAKLPGLPSDLQKVVALEYTVLLRKDGMEEPVDAANYQFNLGDQIRVRIKPLNGLYIYIFHEGSSGERACLLPTETEKPPKVGPDQSLDLPADGSVFEFAMPAGEEKLIVVATEEPSDDLAALAHVVFKKPEDQLTPAEKALQETLKARSQKTLKTIRERQAHGARYRGLFSEEAVSKVAGEIEEKHATRAILEEPPSAKQSSTFAMVASLRGDSGVQLSVTIPLKSIAAKVGRTN